MGEHYWDRLRKMNTTINQTLKKLKRLRDKGDSGGTFLEFSADMWDDFFDIFEYIEKLQIDSARMGKVVEAAKELTRWLKIDEEVGALVAAATLEAADALIEFDDALAALQEEGKP